MAKKWVFMNEEVRPVSFTIGPVGVGWEFIGADRDVASRLLTFLEDKGVLYNPYAKKCPSGVMDSIDKIRDRIQRDMEGLSRESFLFAVLNSMRGHIKQFRNYICRTTCKDDAPRLCKDCKVYESGCTDALDGLRAAIGFEIAQFTGKYGLSVKAPLTSLLPKID